MDNKVNASQEPKYAKLFLIVLSLYTIVFIPMLSTIIK